MLKTYTLPFHKAAKNVAGDIDWKKSDMALQDIFDEKKSMLVNTSSLIVEAMETTQTPSVESFVALDGNLTLQQNNEPLPAEEGNDEIPQPLHDDLDPFLTLDGDDYLLDDEDLRGRQKHDIFHQFKALPIRKLDPG